MAFEQAVIRKFIKSVALFFCHAGTIRIQMVVRAAIRIIIYRCASFHGLRICFQKHRQQQQNSAKSKNLQSISHSFLPYMILIQGSCGKNIRGGTPHPAPSAHPLLPAVFAGIEPRYAFESLRKVAG